MKKILLSILAVMATFMTAGAQATDLSALTDAVYVEPLEAPAGSQQTLSVCMKNSIEVQTIQFDLYLPEGLTIVPNEDEEQMTASKARINKFNYFESSMQSDGALRLLAQATTTNIAVGDGEIATIMVSVPADMALGDYSITVKNILLVSKDNDSKTVDEVTTMITVVEPVDSRVVLDETSTTAPVASNGAVDVLVKRTINANEWSTICLPFSMSATQIQAAFGDDVTVELADAVSYETTEDDDDNIVGITINFNNVSPLAIEANHPYIIKVDKKITSFDVDGVDVNPATSVSGRRKKIGTGSYIIGNYENQSEVPEFSLFLNGNKFWYSTGLTKMKAFRAYFTLRDVLTEVDEAAARIGFSFDEATGIRDNNRETITNNRYYDLQGRSVQTPARKGLYINNGKKVVVK